MIITKNQILGMSNGEILTLPLLIKDYSESLTKTGMPYFNGVCEAKGVLPFKVWSGEVFNRLKAESYRGLVLECKVEVNVYNSQLSLIIKDFKESTISPVELSETPYGTESIYQKFNTLLKKNMSEDGYSVLQNILNPWSESFKVEVASSSNHDNFVSGLLAHTYKMLVVLGYSLKIYKNIAEVANKDLLFMAVTLHDIGKVREYHNGGRSELFFAGHHAMGVDMVAFNREKIISTFGDEFYYRLLSVITQHHGQFGEPPRTLEAYLVHVIDMFESRMQMLNQNLPIQGQVRIDGFTLL